VKRSRLTVNTFLCYKHERRFRQSMAESEVRTPALRCVVFVSTGSIRGWNPGYHQIPLPVPREMFIFPELHSLLKPESVWRYLSPVIGDARVDHWVFCVPAPHMWDTLIQASDRVPQGKVTFVSCDHQLEEKFAAIQRVGQDVKVIEVPRDNADEYISRLPINFLRYGNISIADPNQR
jgi:hypothetical protein